MIVAVPETEKSQVWVGRFPVPVTVRSTVVGLVMTPVAVALTVMLPAHVKEKVPVMFEDVCVEIPQVKLPHPVKEGAAVVAELQVPRNEELEFDV